MTTFEAIVFAIAWFVFATLGLWWTVEKRLTKLEKKIDELIKKLI